MSVSMDGTAKRWRVSDGRLQQTLRVWTATESFPLACALSPADERVAFGSIEGTLEILELSTLSSVQLQLLKPIRALAWTPSGDRLIVGRDDLKVLIIEDGAIAGDLIGNLGSIRDLAISQDGVFVAGGSDDSKAYLWRLSSASLEHTFTGHEKFTHVALSPDGTLLATTDKRMVRIWRTSNGQLLSSYDETALEPARIAFSGDQSVAYTSFYGRIRSRNLVTGELLFDVETLLNGAMAHSAAAGLIGLTGGIAEELELRSAQTGALVRTLVGDRNPVRRILPSPDGQRLLVGGIRRFAEICDTATGAVLATIQMPEPAVPIDADLRERFEKSIYDFAYSPDGTHIFAACEDGKLRAFEASTGALLATHPVSKEHACASIVLLGGGAQALCGLWDGTLKRVQLSDGALLGSVTAHQTPVYSLAVSPDGSTFATGDRSGAVRTWASADAKLVFDLPRHLSSITWLEFSPDGSLLVSAGHDGRVKVWSTLDGNLVHQIEHPSIPGHGRISVGCATFDPSGSRLLTISERDTWFWNVADWSRIAWQVPESVLARTAVWLDDRIVIGRKDCTLLMVRTP